MAVAHSMICCERLGKRYQRQIVLNDFSYEFKDTGFYLLYGTSGSGKTTFLNLLSGLLPFEAGRITVNGESFTEKVDLKQMQICSDYITQDPFFVDFLSVSDNLRMLTDDEGKIKEVLRMFGLEEKHDQYPQTLSGGEKQRLAIARFFIGDKKILFLDEPTASLDVENKRAVFELLSKIKQEVLIICSTHDSVAKEYADEIIPFEKCHELAAIGTEEIVKKGSLKKEKRAVTYTGKTRSPVCFLKKWFTSKSKNRKSSILFCVFLTIAICICMLTDTPENKLESNMEYIYKINMCMLRTYNKDSNLYEELCKLPGIAEVVLDYGLSVPRGETTGDDQSQNSENESFGEMENTGYYQDAGVLPFHKEAFKLYNCIQYGSYFTEKDQIIFSADFAETLMPDAPEKLIGQKWIKNFYNVGSVELEIVGIFKHFNEFEEQYFNAMEYYSTDWYINSEFTRQYAEDEGFYAGTQRGYLLYFDSYKAMRNYYEENYEAYNEQGSTLLIGLEYGRYADVFRLLFITMLPLAIFIAFFSVLFYVNLVKTELAYNNKFVSVFDYAGYPVGRVIRCFSMLNLLYLLKLCAVSAASAFAITAIVNFVNQQKVFVGFQIFSYNIVLLLAFFLLIGTACVFFTGIFLRRLRYSSWYENILKQRDLF